MTESEGLFEELSILNLKMDLEIARHFYECSSQDNRFRLMLYHTLCVSEYEGVRYMAATDTHRLAWLQTSIPVGVYRWLRKPSKDFQWVEPVEEKFPDWSGRVAFKHKPVEKIGSWQPSLGALEFCRKQRINVRLLPQLPACWEIWSTGEDQPGNLKPLVLTPDIERYGTYIQTPMMLMESAGR